MFIREMVEMKDLCIFPSSMVGFTFIVGTKRKHVTVEINSPYRKYHLVIWF